MKIAVVSRRRDDVLLDFLQQKFDVKFAPIDEIRFEVGKELGVYYKNMNLEEFDYVLVFPTNGKADIFYTLLNMLERRASVPIPSGNFLFLWNRLLLFQFLGSNGIKVNRIFGTAQNVVINDVLRGVRPPLTITTPLGKKILISKKSTLLDVTSLFKPGYTLVVERKIPTTSKVYVFVAGDGSIAIEEVAGKRRLITIDEKLKNSANKIRELLSADFCLVKFLRTERGFYVDDVKLSYGKIFLKKTRKNLELLSSAIERKIKVRESPLEIFAEWLISSLRGLRKWI